jgi:hypothetical protein
MVRFAGPRMQTALVVLLFLGAVAVMVYNLYTVLGLP